MLRGFLLMVLGLLMLLALVTWRTCSCAGDLVSRTIEESRKEEEAARQRIPAREVRISELNLQPSYPGAFEATARVANDSRQYTLKAVALNIQLSDCDANGCDIIGDQQVQILQTPVPPGQARDARVRVNFPSAERRRGELRFSYGVAYTEGKP